MATSLTDNAKHVMLNQLATVAVWASLHTGDPSTTGANEATGGSPAYARKAITWNAAASGALDNNANPVFDVAAATYYHIGLWSAVTSGTFYGYAPLGGGARKNFAVDDISTDVFDSPAHGFSDTNQVLVWGADGTLPTGVSEGTVYFIRDATTDTFKLATTSGGTAINITVVGTGVLQKIVPETFAAQGTYTVTDFDITLV